MSVLVTGGGGFVGGAFAAALRARGQRCIAADLEPPEAASGIDAVALDVRDEDAVEAVLHGHAVTHVLHAAAVTTEPHDTAAAGRLVDVNVPGTGAVCRAARRAGVRRVVVASSAAVYEGAGGDLPLHEGVPTRPITRYGASKLAAEAAAFGAAGDALDLRIARLGALFGPFEAPTASRRAMSPLHTLVARARAGQRTRVRERRPLDWLYSLDAAAALTAILFAPELRHGVYNIGGGRPWSLLLACEALARELPGFEFAAAATGPADVESTADRPPLDCTRLADDTGFHPRAPVAAVLDYLRWLESSAPASLAPTR